MESLEKELVMYDTDLILLFVVPVIVVITIASIVDGGVALFLGVVERLLGIDI